VPSGGPVLLTPNHPNGLVDAIVVMRLTPRPIRFIAKATLFGLPVIGFLARGIHAVPVYRRQDDPSQMARNVDAFAAVSEALGQGDVVCVFPEGIAHSEPHLQPLKTGAARMALGAEAASEFTLGVRIVPIGLLYRDKRRFRSNATVEIGTSIDCVDLAAHYERDPIGAVDELTERIGRALERHTLNIDHWDDLPMIEAAHTILVAEHRDEARGDRVIELRKLATAFAALRVRDPAFAESLGTRVMAYARRLASLGLGPGDLDTRYSAATVSRFVVRTLVGLVVGLPFAVLGFVAFFVPYRLTAVIVAIAKPPRELVGSAKIGVGAVLFALWYGGLLAVAALTLAWWWTVLVAIVLPIAGLAAIVVKEHQDEARDDIAVFFRFANRRALRALLLHRRAALADELNDVRSMTRR
jgi:1-acyl-sn-glycerol-3-phosphate acyltransferase